MPQAKMCVGQNVRSGESNRRVAYGRGVVRRREGSKAIDDGCHGNASRCTNNSHSYVYDGTTTESQAFADVVAGGYGQTTIRSTIVWPSDIRGIPSLMGDWCRRP